MHRRCWQHCGYHRGLVCHGLPWSTIQGDSKRLYFVIFQKFTNLMIFGKLLLGGSRNLMSNMSQVQNIRLFQGCDKIVLQLHTAGTENQDTPKHIRVPPISMNITQTPLDTHQTSPRHPPDIYREQEMPTDNNRRHQTKTDSPRHPKTLTSAV